MFESIDRLAPTAREGDILLVGDSVAWKSPYTGQGMNQGVHDGRLAAEAVMDVQNGIVPREIAFSTYGDTGTQPHLTAPLIVSATSGPRPPPS